MNRSAVFVAVAAAALSAGLAGLVLLRNGVKPSPSVASPSTRPTPSSTSSVGRQSAPDLSGAGPAMVPALPSAPAPLDERALMSRLRELRGQHPDLTLQLARDGNERFKDSPDAAERSWFIVKSLSDQGRHEEAKVEGRALVERYRDTRWAEDVYRHLFVNPSTHPFERGFGKVLEQDP